MEFVAISGLECFYELGVVDSAVYIDRRWFDIGRSWGIGVMAGNVCVFGT